MGEFELVPVAKVGEDKVVERVLDVSVLLEPVVNEEVVEVVEVHSGAVLSLERGLLHRNRGLSASDFRPRRRNRLSSMTSTAMAAGP